jgi:hypothetical protein
VFDGPFSDAIRTSALWLAVRIRSFLRSHTSSAGVPQEPMASRQKFASIETLESIQQTAGVDFEQVTDSLEAEQASGAVLRGFEPAADFFKLCTGSDSNRSCSPGKS